MFHRQTLILDNREIASGYFLMKIASSKIVKNSSPGQFLHIKCSISNNPLLRRPLSIHRVTDKKCVEILYKVVGKGTNYLSKRKKGEKIDCLGPLGNGFTFPITNNPLGNSMEFQGPKSRKSFRFLGGKPITDIILVAGGIGIAPLLFLAEKLAQSATCNLVRDVSPNGTLHPHSAIAAFIGAKTKDEILCADKLKKLGASVHIATEDGSLGHKGLVSDLLKNKLSSVIPARQPARFAAGGYLAGGCHLSSVIYACGPKEMLKEVALLSKENEIPCQVSFEQFMGCGIGICNACVIKTKHGYKKVCKDGPVFDAEKINWSKI